MEQQRLEWLRAIPLFGALRSGTLEFLLAQAKSVSVAAGGQFFEEGDPGQSMFVLERGRVAIRRALEGQMHTLARLGVGDCFGEMALIELAARSARVVALEDSDAFEISFERLHALYEHDAEQFLLIQMNMARELSRRLRSAGDLLTRMKVDLKSELGADTDIYGLFM